MTEKTSSKKIAVIRCDIVFEACPGVGCFKAFNERKSHFGWIEVVGGTHH